MKEKKKKIRYYSIYLPKRLFKLSKKYGYVIEYNAYGIKLYKEKEDPKYPYRVTIDVCIRVRNYNRNNHTKTKLIKHMQINYGRYDVASLNKEFLELAYKCFKKIKLRILTRSVVPPINIVDGTQDNAHKINEADVEDLPF